MDLHLLIKRSNDGDKKAKEDIVEYFKPMINKLVKTTYIAGYEDEDLYQIAIITLLRAIEMIDLTKYQCVEGYVYKAIKNYFHTQRGKAINIGISLSLNYKDYEECDNELIDSLADDFNVEEQCILNDDIRKLKLLMKELTKEERSFLIEVYSFGYGGIREYSKVHNKPYNKCYKLKERIIRRLRKSMEIL